MVLRNVMTDRVTLIKQDGRRFENLPASVQAGLILTQNERIPIEEGDRFERSLPSGLVESFVVLDRGFQQRLPGLPAHYQSKVRKETVPVSTTPPAPISARSLLRKPTDDLRTAFGIYKLHEQIGRGGVGAVYRATDDDGHECAIKILDPDKATSRRLRRFQNEILFGSRHEHPNVIRIEDYGATETGPFYVMPLMPTTLRRAMRKGLSPADILKYFSQMLSGLESAHLRTITHRDVKPENMLLDGDGVLVVADWGAAHFEEEDLYKAAETKDDERLANFMYAAPEQKVRGQTVGPPADIFACGLMLNEMFTGSVPHGSGAKEVRDIAPDHAYLDDLIDEMIAQDPTRRPASIDAVKQRLAAHEVLFGSRQKLDALRNTEVVPTSVSSDPLVREPVRIIRRDYDPNGYLVVMLNHQVPKAWVDVFYRMTGVNFEPASGLEPGRVEFRADAVARVAVDPDRAANAYRYMTAWIERANSDYAEQDRRSREAFDRQQRAEAKRQLEREEARLRALRQLPPI